MSTLNSFYVRTATNTALIIEAVQAKFPYAEIDGGIQFCSVRLSPSEFGAPEPYLKRLSFSYYTDVFWLSFQSASDSFRFHHWHAGEHLRCLIYGCVDPLIWERVEGTPQRWEREVFFDHSQLECALEEADSEEGSRELERIWHSAEIQAGRTEPALDSRECARAIANHFNFPGWNR
jgi:hypothetical protein